MAPKNYDSLLVNWKCLLACLLVSMCPFQYGIDFGLIAGLQGTTLECIKTCQHASDIYHSYGRLPQSLWLSST